MKTQLPDGILIRHAQTADINSLRELRLEALQNHPSSFGSDYSENILKPITYWEEILTIDNEEEALFFAEYHDQLVGMAGISRRVSKKNMHSAGIWGVYVKTEWRGRHIAEALIQSCLNWARQLNVVVVKLGVVTNNPSAISCYKRCGFTIYGKEPKAIKYEEVYYDEYLMSVELSEL